MRSTSVGDIIVEQKHIKRCENAGWKDTIKVDEPTGKFCDQFK